ncbi:unnamed protein product [Mytilus coruscus]|uniref:AIG1-type G domain-containing protein n=1 Tax=Mytilus coruscus TaxID=42192 RepID=A0A6J8E394_MYTCO|nr:unnamed protein product [Mytilus coruscus]
MVGKTGSGKSATGNTIMTKANHFLSKLSGGSVTSECKRGECSQAGRKIVVIDTPGLFDTQAPREQISKEIINCVNMSTPGPHVFLLVVQIARFTDEEIETFNRLFDLFGAEMGRFAIITFTKLDDLERGNTTIESYIDEAPKKMKEFLIRCHGRYIAFDNNACEKNKTAKVKSLIQLVDSIVNKNGGKWYTNKMYREAEAALQRKIKLVEEEKALEKKKEIERIQSTFVNQIDSIKQDNKKLAKQVSSKENLQRQIQKDKEKALQEIQRMKEEMKKIDKKRNEELYRIKKQEKEEKEKQANALEEKERQQMQFLRGIQEQQIEMNRKYQEMEQQKELQLSKAAEQHSKIMEAEIQRIVDGNNQKYNELMKALESKDRANEKLQDQMAQQNASMQEIMRERNQRNNELLKQQEENLKRMAVEKKRAEETLRMQLKEQKNAMDAKTKAILQDQMERDKKQREEFEAATLKANEILQAKMEHQNSLMQNLMREREQDFLKQQENQKKSMDAKTEAMLQKQRERDEKQRKEFEELKLQNESMQEQLKKEGCLIS